MSHAAKTVDRCWRVTVSRRGKETPHKSLLVSATTAWDAASKMLRHLGAPDLDLEVTALERLPSEVITRPPKSDRKLKEVVDSGAAGDALGDLYDSKKRGIGRRG